MLQHSRPFNTPGKSILFGNPSSNIFYLEDISINFGEINALKSVQFSVEKGEIVFITGASGSGKTTLLRILSSDLTPTSGKLRLPNAKGTYGKPLFISQIFQDLRLMWNHSCEDNLMLTYDPSIYRSKKLFIQDMKELCRILGIDNRLHLKIRDTNGGMKQKVAIIRALLSKPDILIADEPTSSLDTTNSKKIFDVLNLYNVKKGLTVIWATHNAELVKKFTGRIVHLDCGRLIYSGHACFI